MTEHRSTRYECTQEAPWKPEYGTPVTHGSTQKIGEQEDGWPGGDIVTIECRFCGHRWKQELPQ
jgi:hypothetical protein